jgi:hypothetical protein
MNKVIFIGVIALALVLTVTSAKAHIAYASDLSGLKGEGHFNERGEHSGGNEDNRICIFKGSCSSESEDHGNGDSGGGSGSGGSDSGGGSGSGGSDSGGGSGSGGSDSGGGDDS